MKKNTARTIAEFYLKEESKHRCCINWKIAVSNLNVRDNCDPIINYSGKALAELLKYLLGNFCPCCGKRLNPKAKRKN